MAAGLALSAALIVTVTTRAGNTVDVAPLAVGGVLLFGAACFELGRSARRSQPHALVTWLLRGIPAAAVTVIVLRGTALETPALLLFGALCASVAVLVPVPLGEVATDVQRIGTTK